MSILGIQSATLAKFRRIESPTLDQLRSHGEVVLQTIRSANRSALARELPTVAINCASGTSKADGRAILTHMRKKHAAEFAAAVNADRRRRTDAEIVEAYEAAMAEKRARQEMAMAA